MKILVVDDELDYILLFKYLFDEDLDLQVEYVSEADELREIDGEEFGAVLCDFYLGDFGTAIDAFELLKEKGFEGRFIIVSSASKPVILQSLIESDIYGVEIVEKGRSYILRQILYGLTHE